MDKIRKDTNKEFANIEEQSRRTVEIMEKINSEVRNTTEKLINMEEEMKEERFSVKRKIEGLNKKVLHNQKHINTIQRSGNNSQTRLSYVNFGENKLNFNGNVKKQHPVPFIKFIKNKLENFIDFNEYKEFIRS